MKTATIFKFLTLATLATARPLPSRSGRVVVREVPQEHSHERILRSVAASLNQNNPDGIQDPVFALLGNAVRLEFTISWNIRHHICSGSNLTLSLCV